MNPILACIYRRDVSSLRRLLGGLDSNSRLSHAHLDEGLRVMLSHTDTQDDYWMSSRIQTAEMLLMAGANANLYMDEEPLICKMVQINDTEMVMLLLFQFRCNTDARVKTDGEQGKTALHFAVELQNEEMLQLLLSTGASANIGDNCGNRPLHVLLSMFCSKIGNEDEMRKYMNFFDALLPLTDLSVVNNEGNSMLHSAVTCQAPCEIIKQILNVGINVNRKNAIGETALLTACKVGYVDAVKELLSCDNDISLSTSAGNTAAHYAALHSTQGLDIMNLLLEKGLNVNLCNNKGLLPIHMSIKSGNVAVTQLLVLNNCDMKKVGLIIYDDTRNTLTLDNDKLKNSLYDPMTSYWNHFDFIELGLLVIAGCDVHPKAMNVIRQMAVDVNTRKPMNWRNSLYGIKKRYNLHTLLLAAEMLQEYSCQPGRLQHLCRLRIRKIVQNIQNIRNVTFFDISKCLGLPVSLSTYVMLGSLNGFQIPKSLP